MVTGKSPPVLRANAQPDKFPLTPPDRLSSLLRAARDGMQRGARGMCVLLAAALAGCAGFREPATPPAVPPYFADPAASTEEDGIQPREGFQPSDFSPDQLGYTIQRVTGNGPDRELAQQLLAEGDRLYARAGAARAANDPSAHELFEEAAEAFDEAADRWPDSIIEQDALFRSGEAYFLADRLTSANDRFEQLLQKYPNSRYTEFAQARRFAVAQYWLELDAADPLAIYEVNVFDGSRPWKDEFGHAVRVFEKMALDDPTGKLADDAIMAAGHALFRSGRYLQADEKFTDLRQAYPSSEHQFWAHYLGAEAKLRGHAGPDYPGTALEEAEALVEQMRRQFPEQSREYAADLSRQYGEIRHSRAAEEWRMAQFYDRRRKFAAARFYYASIADQFADTAYAEPARERINEIAGEPPAPPQRLEWLVNLFPDTDPAEPLLANSPTEGLTR